MAEISDRMNSVLIECMQLGGIEVKVYSGMRVNKILKS